MGYDQAAPKRVVQVILNSDLLRQAEQCTDDLSSTLETLLAEFVSREERRQEHDPAATAELIAALDALHEECGLLSEEYQEF